jgi:hypothetical protein
VGAEERQNCDATDTNDADDSAPLTDAVADLHNNVDTAWLGAVADAVEAATLENVADLADSPPCLDASITALIDDFGSRVSPDSYTMKLPSLLTPIMFDYIQNIGLLQLVHDCITNPCGSFSNSITQCRHMWNLRHSPLPKKSIMYWISPSDDATNSNMLYYLTASGLHQVLQQLSTVLGDNIKHLTLYQMMFIIVHSCEELHLHTDFDPSLSKQAYTLLFPILLADGSPPKIIIKQQGSSKLLSFQYEKGHAFLWGTRHAACYCHDKLSQWCL